MLLVMWARYELHMVVLFLVIEVLRGTHGDIFSGGLGYIEAHIVVLFVVIEGQGSIHVGIVSSD